MHRLSTFIRWSLVIVMVIVSGLWMLGASRGDSAIMDELAHIPAGYGYVRYLDYRLNPEHPPLVKILAGLPLLFQNLNFSRDVAEWQTGINEQWTLGTKFLYESGNNADKIIFSSRLGPILLTLILTILIYLFAKELIGRWWALLPVFLFAFSPTVLAHGHYVTTDIGAALGVFLAVYFFLKFLSSPIRRHLIFAGLAFGIAQLFKFSNFLLGPYFIILMTVFYAVSVFRDWQMTDLQRGRMRRFAIRFYRYFRSLAMIFLIGFAAVYLVYGILTWNYPIEKQVGDAENLLRTFTPRFLADSVAWMSSNHVLRPIGEYLLGLLMVSQRAAGGNTAYFLDEVSNEGWWYYFPVVFLLKEPLPSLLIIIFGIITGLAGVFRGLFATLFKRSLIVFEYLTTHFSEFAMILFVVIYWLSSITSILNIGVRHLLPTMPFTYILAVGVLKRFFSLEEVLSYKNKIVRLMAVIGEFTGLVIKALVLAILLGWFLASTIIVYPNFLSYFNFLGGGASKGYLRVVDSNYDWGQDLKRLATWVAEQNNDNGQDNDIKKIAVDYFGGSNPNYYLGETAELWNSAKGNPKEEAGIEWLAVSINTIQGAKGRLGAGQRNPADEYEWLTEPYKPYARAGKSIFIYKF